MGSFDITIAQKVAVAIALPVASFLLYFLLKKSNEEEEESSPRVVTSRQTLIEVKVPRNAAGVIIGPRGARIKEVQDSTGARIQFKDDVGSDSPQRTVVIRGQVEAAQRAEMIIRHMIAEIPPIVKDSLNVPERAIGRIIGRGGETIRSLCRSSKCKINVPQEQRLGGIQRILLEGSPTAISTAKALIEEKVKEEEAFRARIAVNASNRQERGPRRREGATEITHQEAISLLQAEEDSWDAQPKSEPARTDDVDATPSPATIAPETAKWTNHRDYLEVYVSAVEHPGHFWVQVISSKATKLDDLSQDMTQFYSHMNEGEAAIVDEIREDDLLAAPFPFDDQWYRVRVTEVGDDKVDAYYVDFGDSYWVEKSKLKSLRSDFLSLPFQAIEVCLANVKPNGDTWSEDANILFEELTHMAKWKVINARTVSYTKTIDGESMPCVELIDTNGPKDVNVAKVLIERGFAEFVQEKETDTSSDVSSNMQIDDVITYEEIARVNESELMSSVDPHFSSPSYCRKRRPHRNSKEPVNSSEDKEDLFAEEDLIDTVSHQGNVSCNVYTDTSTSAESKVPFDYTSPCVHVEPFDQRLLQATFLEDDFVSDIDVFYDAKEDRVKERSECERKAYCPIDISEHATVKMQGVNDFSKDEVALNPVKMEHNDDATVLLETSIRLCQTQHKDSEHMPVQNKNEFLVSETKDQLAIRPKTLDVDTQKAISIEQPLHSSEMAAKQLYQSSLSSNEQYPTGLSESCHTTAEQEVSFHDTCDVIDNATSNIKGVLSDICMEVPQMVNTGTKDDEYAPESVSVVHDCSQKPTNSCVSTDRRDICLNTVDESIDTTCIYRNKEDISKKIDLGNVFSFDESQVDSDISTQGSLHDPCDKFSIRYAERTEAGAKVGCEIGEPNSAADYNKVFGADQVMPYNECSSHSKTADSQTPISHYDENCVESEGTIVHKGVTEVGNFGLKLNNSVCSVEDMHVSYDAVGGSSSPRPLDVEAHPLLNSTSLLVLGRQCEGEDEASVGQLLEEMCPIQNKTKEGTMIQHSVPITSAGSAKFDIGLTSEVLATTCLSQDKGQNVPIPDMGQVYSAQDTDLSKAKLSSIPVYETQYVKEFISPQAISEHWASETHLSEVAVDRQFALVEKETDILVEHLGVEACTAEDTDIARAEQNSVSVYGTIHVKEEEVISQQVHISHCSDQTGESSVHRESTLADKDTDILVENSLLDTESKGSHISVECPNDVSKDVNCEQNDTLLMSSSELQIIHMNLNDVLVPETQHQEHEITSSSAESFGMPYQDKHDAQSDAGCSTKNPPRDSTLTSSFEIKTDQSDSAFTRVVQKLEHSDDIVTSSVDMCTESFEIPVCDTTTCLNQDEERDLSITDISKVCTPEDADLSRTEQASIPDCEIQQVKEEQVISQQDNSGNCSDQLPVPLEDLAPSYEESYHLSESLVEKETDMPVVSADVELLDRESLETDIPVQCPSQELKDVNCKQNNVQMMLSSEPQHKDWERTEVLLPQMQDQQPEIPDSVAGSSNMALQDQQDLWCTESPSDEAVPEDSVLSPSFEVKTEQSNIVFSNEVQPGAIATKISETPICDTTLHVSQDEEQNLPIIDICEAYMPEDTNLSRAEQSSFPEDESQYVKGEQVILSQQGESEQCPDQTHLSDICVDRKFELVEEETKMLIESLDLEACAPESTDFARAEPNSGTLYETQHVTEEQVISPQVAGEHCSDQTTLSVDNLVSSFDNKDRLTESRNRQDRQSKETNIPVQCSHEGSSDVNCCQNVTLFTSSSESQTMYLQQTEVLVPGIQHQEGEVLSSSAESFNIPGQNQNDAHPDGVCSTEDPSVGIEHEDSVLSSSSEVQTKQSDIAFPREVMAIDYGDDSVHSSETCGIPICSTTTCLDQDEDQNLSITDTRELRTPEDTDFGRMKQSSIPVYESQYVKEQQVTILFPHVESELCSGQSHQMESSLNSQVPLVKKDTILVENAGYDSLEKDSTETNITVECLNEEHGDVKCEQKTLATPCSESQIMDIQQKEVLLPKIQHQQPEIPSSPAGSSNMTLQDQQDAQSDVLCCTESPSDGTVSEDSVLSPSFEVKTEQPKAVDCSNYCELTSADAISTETSETPICNTTMHVSQDEEQNLSITDTCEAYMPEDTNLSKAEHSSFREDESQYVKEEQVILSQQVESEQCPDQTHLSDICVDRKFELVEEETKMLIESLDLEACAPESTDFARAEPNSGTLYETQHVTEEQVISPQVAGEHCSDQTTLSVDNLVSSFDTKDSLSESRNRQDRQSKETNIPVQLSHEGPNDVNCKQNVTLFTSSSESETMYLELTEVLVPGIQHQEAEVLSSSAESFNIPGQNQNDAHPDGVCSTEDPSVGIEHEDSVLSSSSEVQTKQSDVAFPREVMAIDYGDDSVHSSETCGIPICSTTTCLDQDEDQNSSIDDTRELCTPEDTDFGRMKQSSIPVYESQHVKEQPVTILSPHVDSELSPDQSHQTQSSLNSQAPLVKKDSDILVENAGYDSLDKDSTETIITVECLNEELGDVKCEQKTLATSCSESQIMDIQQEEVLLPKIQHQQPEIPPIEQNEVLVPEIQYQQPEIPSSPAGSSNMTLQDQQDAQSDVLCCTESPSDGTVSEDSVLSPSFEVKTELPAIAFSNEVQAVDCSDYCEIILADAISTETSEAPICDTTMHVSQDEQNLSIIDICETYRPEDTNLSRAEQSSFPEDESQDVKEEQVTLSQQVESEQCPDQTHLSDICVDRKFELVEEETKMLIESLDLEACAPESTDFARAEPNSGTLYETQHVTEEQVISPQVAGEHCSDQTTLSVDNLVSSFDNKDSLSEARNRQDRQSKETNIPPQCSHEGPSDVNCCQNVTLFTSSSESETMYLELTEVLVPGIQHQEAEVLSTSAESGQNQNDAHTDGVCSTENPSVGIQHEDSILSPCIEVQTEQVNTAFTRETMAVDCGNATVHSSADAKYIESSEILLCDTAMPLSQDEELSLTITDTSESCAPEEFVSVEQICMSVYQSQNAGEQMISSQEVYSEHCSQKTPVPVASSVEGHEREADMNRQVTLAGKDMDIVHENPDYESLDKDITDTNSPVECSNEEVNDENCECYILVTSNSVTQDMDIEENEVLLPGIQHQQSERPSSSDESSIMSLQGHYGAQFDAACCTEDPFIRTLHKDSVLSSGIEVQTEPSDIAVPRELRSVDCTDDIVHSLADVLSTETFEIPIVDTTTCLDKNEGHNLSNTSETCPPENSASTEQCQHSTEQLVSSQQEVESEHFSDPCSSFDVQAEQSDTLPEAVEPEHLGLEGKGTDNSSIPVILELNDPETEHFEGYPTLMVLEEHDLQIAQHQTVPALLTAELRKVPQAVNSPPKFPEVVEYSTPSHSEPGGTGIQKFGSIETSLSPVSSDIALKDGHSDQTERPLQAVDMEKPETSLDEPLVLEVQEEPAKEMKNPLQFSSGAEIDEKDKPEHSSTQQCAAYTQNENVSVSDEGLSTSPTDVIQNPVEASLIYQLPGQTQSPIAELHKVQTDCTDMNGAVALDDTQDAFETTSSLMHDIEGGQEEMSQGILVVRTDDNYPTDCHHESVVQSSELQGHTDGLSLQQQKEDTEFCEICGIPVDGEEDLIPTGCQEDVPNERVSEEEHDPCLPIIDNKNRNNLQSSITEDIESIGPPLSLDQEMTSKDDQENSRDSTKSEEFTGPEINIDNAGVGNEGIPLNSKTPDKHSPEHKDSSCMESDNRFSAEYIQQVSDSYGGEVYQQKPCDDAEHIEVTLCSTWDPEHQVIEMEEKPEADVKISHQNVDSEESLEDSMSEITVVSLFGSEVTSGQQLADIAIEQRESEQRTHNDCKIISKTNTAYMEVEQLSVSGKAEQAPNSPGSSEELAEHQEKQIEGGIENHSELNHEIHEQQAIANLQTQLPVTTETTEEYLTEVDRLQKPTTQMSEMGHSGYFDTIEDLCPEDTCRSPDTDSAYASPTLPTNFHTSSITSKMVIDTEEKDLLLHSINQQNSECVIMSNLGEKQLEGDEPENLQPDISGIVNDEYTTLISLVDDLKEQLPGEWSTQDRRSQIEAELPMEKDDNMREITNDSHKHQEEGAGDQGEESNCSGDEDAPNQMPSLIGMKMYKDLLEVITSDGSESVDSGLQLQDHLPSDDSKHDAIKEWLMVQASPVLDISSSVWSEGSNTSSCRELIDACQGEECLEIDVPCCMETSVDEGQDLGKFPPTESFILNPSAADCEAFDSLYKSDKFPTRDRKGEFASFRLHSSMEVDETRNPELVSSNYDERELATALKGCYQESLSDAFFKTEPSYADATARKEVSDRLVGHLAPQYAPSFRRCSSTGDIETEREMEYSAVASWSEDEYTGGRRQYAYDDQYGVGYDDDSSSMDSLEEQIYPAASAMRHRSPSRGYTTAAAAGQPRHSSRGETRHCSLYDEFQDMLEEFYAHASLVSLESATATTSTSYASALEDLPSNDVDQVLTDSLEELTAEDIGATYPDILYPPSLRSSISQDSLNDINDISSTNGGGEEICETNSSFTDDSIEDAYDTDEGGPRVIYGTQLEQTLFEANITPTVEFAAPFPASPQTPTASESSKDSQPLSHTTESPCLPPD